MRPELSKTKITVCWAEGIISLKASDIIGRETDVKIQREVFGKIMDTNVWPNFDTSVRMEARKRIT